MAMASPNDDDDTWTSVLDDDDLDDAELGERLRAELTDAEYDAAMTVLARRWRRMQPAGKQQAVRSTRPRPTRRPADNIDTMYRFSSIPHTMQLTGTVKNASSFYLKRKDQSQSEQYIPDPSKLGRDTIVFNPGSRSLRVGLASDALPRSIAHVMARRLKAGANRPPNGTSHIFYDLEESSERDHELRVIEGLLKERLRAMKKRHSKETENQARQHNAQARPEPVSDQSDPYPTLWIGPDEDKRDVFIGDQVFKLMNWDDFHVLFPIANGRLNFASAPSVEYLLSSIEVLWTMVLETELKIARKYFKTMCAVLVVSDVMPRSEVKHLVSILIDRLGFNSVLVQQELVCVTFGAGVSYSCVVDVGAQKTAVCCVEDGVVLPMSKLILPYGGEDVTRLLAALLRGVQFPYTDCQLSNPHDYLLMENLKQLHCSLNEEDIGLHHYDFYSRQPNKIVQRYRYCLFDQSIKAPLALFHLRVIASDLARTLKRTSKSGHIDPDDYLDEQYLHDIPLFPTSFTRSRYALGTLVPRNRKSRAKQRGDTASGGAAAGVGDDDDNASENEDEDEGGEESDDEVDDDVLIKPKRSKTDSDDMPMQPPPKSGIKISIDAARIQSAANALAGMSAPTPTDHTILAQAKASPMTPLDEAVLSSIDKLDSEDRKKRMLSSILLSGGGLMFGGMGSVLNDRLVGRLTNANLASSVNVITSAKDLDSRVLAWKGGAVLARQETVRDSWIGKREWTIAGVRLLRERTMFEW